MQKIISVKKYIVPYTTSLTRIHILEDYSLKRQIENVMVMINFNQLEGHVSGTFHEILISSCKTKATVNAKGYKYKFVVVQTVKYGITKVLIYTINHLIDVFYER